MKLTIRAGHLDISPELRDLPHASGEAPYDDGPRTDRRVTRQVSVLLSRNHAPA